MPERRATNNRRRAEPKPARHDEEGRRQQATHDVAQALSGIPKMRPAVFEPRKVPRLGAVRTYHRLHGAQVHRERSGKGLFGAGSQGACQRVQRARHLHRIDRRAHTFGRRKTRTIVETVEQADRHEHRKHCDGRHGRAALRYPAPRAPQMLLGTHVERGGDDATDQDENQRVGPEHDGNERHHCSRIRGSTRVYEISVISNPTIVSTVPMKTMARTMAKSWARMASMIYEPRPGMPRTPRADCP